MLCIQSSATSISRASFFLKAPSATTSDVVHIPCGFSGLAEFQHWKAGVDSALEIGRTLLMVAKTMKRRRESRHYFANAYAWEERCLWTPTSAAGATAAAAGATAATNLMRPNPRSDCSREYNNSRRINNKIPPSPRKRPRLWLVREVSEPSCCAPHDQSS